MQVAGRETFESEWIEQARVLADDDLRHFAPDADHLVAVIRVEDRVDVRLQVVEDREVVGGERADAAGARVPVERAATREAAEPMRERGTPHVGETRVDVRRLGIGVELDVLPDDERRAAALDAVPVALEVDSPELVGDELP